MNDRFEHSGSDDKGFVNMFGTSVELRGNDWCVVATVDGRPHVVSRHPTPELAEAASQAANSAANYERFQP